LATAHTFHPRRLEFVALLPSHKARHGGSLPSQGKTESCHGCVPGEIHLRMIFITGLMIMFGREFVRLLHSPSRVVAFVFHSFIHGECGNSHTRQAEVICAVVMSCLGASIRTDVQAKLLS